MGAVSSHCHHGACAESHSVPHVQVVMSQDSGHYDVGWQQLKQLILACLEGNVQAVEQQLGQQADAESIAALLTTSQEKMMTPTSAAFSTKHVDVVEVLLSRAPNTVYIPMVAELLGFVPGILDWSWSLKQQMYQLVIAAVDHAITLVQLDDKNCSKQCEQLATSIAQLPTDQMSALALIIGQQQGTCLRLIEYLQKHVEPSKDDKDPPAHCKHCSDKKRSHPGHLRLLAALAVLPAAADAKLAKECFKGLWQQYSKDEQEASVGDQDHSKGDTADMNACVTREDLEQLMQHIGNYMPGVLSDVLSKVELQPIKHNGADKLPLDPTKVQIPTSAPALVVETCDYENPTYLNGYSATDFLFPRRRAPWTDIWKAEGKVWKPVLYAMAFYGFQLQVPLIQLPVPLAGSQLFLMLGTFILWLLAVPVLSVLHRLGSAVRYMGAELCERCGFPHLLQHKPKACEPSPGLCALSFTQRTTKRVPVPDWASFSPASVLQPLLAAGTDSERAAVFNTPLVRAYIMHRWHRRAQFVLAAQLLEHVSYMAIFICYAFVTSRRLNSVVTDADNGLSVPLEQCANETEIGLLTTLGLMTASYLWIEICQAVKLWNLWKTSIWSALDVGSLGLMMVIIIFHASCAHFDMDWSWVRVWNFRGMAACQILLLFLRLTYYSLAIPRVGSFVHMVLQVMQDMSLFILLLCVVFVGFSTSFAVLQGAAMEDLSADAVQTPGDEFQGSLQLDTGNLFNSTYLLNSTFLSLTSTDEGDGRLVASGSVGDIFMQMFTLIFGGLDSDYLGQSLGPRRIGVLWAVLKAMYQVLVAIVLLNLLIAIINSSYSNVKDQQDAIDMRNKAQLIVESEVMKADQSAEVVVVNIYTFFRRAMGLCKGKEEDLLKWDDAFNKTWMFVAEDEPRTDAAQELGNKVTQMCKLLKDDEIEKLRDALLDHVPAAVQKFVRSTNAGATAGSAAAGAAGAQEEERGSRVSPTDTAMTSSSD